MRTEISFLMQGMDLLMFSNIKKMSKDAVPLIC